MLPPALLCAALGLVLAFAPPPARLWALLAALGTMAAFSLLRMAPLGIEIVFLGCWLSVIATAAAVHLAGALGVRSLLLLSVNAGFWSSAVVTAAGVPLDLVKASASLLLVVPASWLVARRASVAVAVVSSWLIAIAALAAVLPFLPVTPGYMPDHIE